jgi:hypothetical protein
LRTDIQAPSQQNLRQETVSLTSTDINTIPPIQPEANTTAEQPPAPAPPPQQPVAQPMPAPAPVPMPQPPMPQPPQPMPPNQPAPMPRPPVAPGQPVPPQRPPQPRPQQPQPKPKKLTKEQQEKLSTAQNSLLISEIRENMVIMNDGSFRAVVACESINYDLMSSEERDGIEYSYQNFLNTLYFPIQILIESRRIDIKPYLDKLEQIRAKQENMLLGVLMDDYLDFIFDISQQANIMRKDFFVVIPYRIGGDGDSSTTNFKNLSDDLLSSIQKPAHITIDAKSYDKAKDEIRNRVSVVLNGLMNIGVRAGQLPTKALSELYYNFYNPDTALEEPVTDFSSYTNALYIKKGQGSAPRPGVEGV